MPNQPPTKSNNSGSYLIILLVFLYSIYAELYWLTAIAALLGIVKLASGRNMNQQKPTNSVFSKHTSVEKPTFSEQLRGQSHTKEGMLKDTFQALKQLDLMENVHELPVLKDHYSYLLNDLYPELQAEFRSGNYAEKVQQSVENYKRVSKKELTAVQAACMEDPTNTNALKEFYADRVYSIVHLQLETVIAAMANDEQEKQSGIKQLLTLTELAKQEIRHCGMSEKNISYLDFIAEKREMLFTMRLSS